MRKKIIIVISLLIIIPILIFGIIEYHNYQLIQKAIFKLNGDNIININIGDMYIDTDYICQMDNQNCSQLVSKNGEIKLTEIGKNTITYTLKKGMFHKTLTREINILDKDIDTGFSLTLNKESTFYHMKNKKYTEPGAIAIDKNDGDISSKIIIDGHVDFNKVGTYEITYQVTNSNGVTKSITRQVKVYSFQYEAKLKYEEAQKDNEIIIEIKDQNYNRTILPNNETTKEKNINYKVKENGTYTFTFYDNNNSIEYYTVEVKNIDNTPPTATCLAQVYSHYIDIKTNKTSNEEISGYNYIIDGKETNYISNPNYRINQENANSIKVQVKDKLDNSSISVCKIELMDPTIGNNKIKYYMRNKIEYVIANTKNELTTFEKTTCGKISQNADPAECGNACLSFSCYHAAYIQYGILSNMNEYDACHYNYGGLASLKIMSNKTKKQALEMVYNAINNGQTPVLQVTGTKARVSRHFVLVVGYKREIYSASELKEEDLLVIDSWTGCFSSLSFTDKDKRTMFDNKDGYGYRVDLLIK